MRLFFSLFFMVYLLITFPMISFSSVESEVSFRSRANVVIEPDWTTADTVSEIEFGRKLAARILGQYPILDHPSLQEYVNLLGQGLAGVVGRPELRYYFIVLDSEHVNAYATPGGYIFLTKGLIEKCEDEAQLLGVIAHEMSHINRRYIVKKFNIRGKDSSLLSDAGVMIGGATQTARLALNVVVGQVMDMLLMEGLDKDEELAADKDAVFYLALVNYDWQRYATLVESLATDSDLKSVSATHPSTNDRKKVMWLYAQENNLEGVIQREERFNAYVQI